MAKKMHPHHQCSQCRRLSFVVGFVNANGKTILTTRLKQAMEAERVSWERTVN